MERISPGVERLTQSKRTTMERRWSYWRKVGPPGISSAGEVVTATWASNLRWKSSFLGPIMLMVLQGRILLRLLHIQAAANLLNIPMIILIIFHFHRLQYQSMIIIVTMNIPVLLDLIKVVVFLILLPSYSLGLMPSGFRFMLEAAASSFSAAPAGYMSLLPH